HLQEFKNSKKLANCNLNALQDSLSFFQEAVQNANFVQSQRVYQSQKELLTRLPELEKEQDILAIPIAIKAFSFFRHFVTIIVDKRAGIIEFYDPLGFSTSQYKNAILWGPKCPKKELLSLSTLLKAIQEKYGIEKVVENTTIHQKDPNQCALFVFDRIYKRGVLDMSFEEASKKPLCSLQGYIYA
nr:hypothetical protein [bacterium]